MRSLVIGLCCLALAGVAAGCAALGGRTTAHVTAPRPVVGLCSHVDAVQSAEVRRVLLITSNDMRFPFPARVMIRSAVRARALARTICALPRSPGGYRPCPADLGVKYLIRFGGIAGVISIEAGGCGDVSGAGPVRSVSPSFFSLFRQLRKAMGLGKVALNGFFGRPLSQHPPRSWTYR